MQPVTWPLFYHYLSFCFIFCGFISFNTLWVLPFLTWEELVRLSCDPENCVLWFELFLYIKWPSLQFCHFQKKKKRKEMKIKAVLSTWILALLQDSVSFAGNELSESWTQISPGTPGLLELNDAYDREDVGSTWEDWLRARLGRWRVFILSPFYLLLCTLPELRVFLSL